MSTNKNKKNRNVFIATIILIVLGSFAYAYFQAQLGIGTSSEITVNPKTTDNLKFATCGDAIITLTQFNFTEGGNNNSSSTCAKAKLKANNDTNSATQTYNVYVFINKNNFIYTTNNNTPEIIMSVTDPLGNPVTTITGLTYTTSGGVSGFDVTTQKGLFQIASDYTISTTTTKIDTWNITFTAINLDTNQSANSGHSFKAQAIIKADEYKFEVAYDNCPNPEITNDYFLMCDDSLLACKVAKDFDYENINDSKVVLHNGIVLDETDSCKIIDAEDNSYRYTGGDYDITQKAINEGYDYINTSYGNTTGGVIGVNCNGTNRYVGYSDSSCSTKYYYLLYDTNVTQYSTYDEAIAQAITDGYVVARNINNFVCFGYDTSVTANETTCPEQNLYRIIGAFDDDNDGNYNVKLIKADYASTTEFGTNVQNGTSSYYSNYTSSQYTRYYGTISSVNRFIWYGTSTNYSNRWDNSTFRSGVLNNYYLNTYLNGNDPKWKNMIDEKTYYLGGPGKTGYNTTSGSTKTLYNTERTAEAVYDTSTYPVSINDYIGLIYISDHWYASKSKYWNLKWHNSAKGNDKNWLNLGLPEWSISQKSDSTSTAYYYAGDGTYVSSKTTNSFAVRPTFYLKPNVTIQKGNGSKSNPYYISLSS